MFYKTFSKITDKLNEEFINEFDYWLATLPENRQKNISASLVANKFEVSLPQAKIILKYASDKKILEMNYAIKCPNDECGLLINIIKPENLLEELASPILCPNCGVAYSINAEDILIVYNRIKKPDATDEEIEAFINDHLGIQGDDINFTDADSLRHDIDMIFDALYCPTESAYSEMESKYALLDKNYGSNTTAKGGSLENLTLFLFDQIKGFRGTNKIRTETNQFDCTVCCSFEYIRDRKSVV